MILLLLGLLPRTPSRMWSHRRTWATLWWTSRSPRTSWMWRCRYRLSNLEVKRLIRLSTSCGLSKGTNNWRKRLRSWRVKTRASSKKTKCWWRRSADSRTKSTSSSSNSTRWPPSLRALNPCKDSKASTTANSKTLLPASKNSARVRKRCKCSCWPNSKAWTSSSNSPRRKWKSCWCATNSWRTIRLYILQRRRTGLMWS